MKRPYFFEVFIVANFILIQALLWRMTRLPLVSLARMFALLLPAFVIQAVAGMAVRLAIRQPSYAQTIRSRAWLLDTLRLAIFSVLSAHVYGWIKLSVPLLNRNLFDPQLWQIDAAIFGGHSPNIFFLTLFGGALRFFDFTYANVFLASIWFAGIYFLSDPDRRVRIGFMNSNTLLWIVGAWLYVLVPSLGPAYRFPQIWIPLAAMLPETQALQRILMHNYQNIFRAGAPINVLYGVAAFPSLHVAFEFLVWLWLRKLWKPGAILFAIFSVIIFIGSIVTGWHYLIDAIAGLALALLCFVSVRAVFSRPEVTG
jgi:hypothetical protein